MSGSTQKTSAGKLVVLMVTAFMDMVGLLMIVPMLPFYAQSMGASAFTIGALVSSFAIAQLLSAPLWGRFSDHYGRRPALIVGLSAAGIAYVVFAFADSLWLLLISRLVQGAGGGTVSVIQAYVADALEPKERAKGLGWLSAATNAGVALGPLLGGLALTWGGRSAPGLLAAALSLVNIGFAWRYLTESRDMAEARSKPRLPGTSRRAVTQVVTHPNQPASRLIWIYAIGMGAFQGAMTMLALLLALRFGVTEATIGFFFAYIGVISVVARAGILGWAVDRYGEARLTRLGSTLLALGMGLLPFIRPIADPAAVSQAMGGMLPESVFRALPYLPLALVVALIPLGTAFTFPCVTALLSRVVPSNERGLYMGVQQTFGGSARVIFPILSGFLFDRVVELPFVLSATLVVATILLGRNMESYAKGS